MFYAYVIQSKKDGSLYKGHCEDLELRLRQHNSGSTASIKNKVPFEIVYFEAFNSREEAIIREKYYKSGAGRRFLNNKLGSKRA